MNIPTQIPIRWLAGSSGKSASVKIRIRHVVSPRRLSPHELWCLVRTLAKAELRNTSPSLHCRRLLQRAVKQFN